jgi:hypothetical protein
LILTRKTTASVAVSMKATLLVSSTAAVTHLPSGEM